MPDFHPTGLSPTTPAPRAPAQTERTAQAVHGQPVSVSYPIAGRPAPVRLPVSARAFHAARSVRLAAADVSQRLNHSMRAAAQEVERLSAGAWCWVKFKTQWQFWLALTLLMLAWYFGAQRPANIALKQAQSVYDAKYQEVATIQTQVNGLRQVYEPLRRGDPYAWQMLARHQLGWKQKSEIITVEAKPAQAAQAELPSDTATQPLPLLPAPVPVVAPAAPVVPATPVTPPSAKPTKPAKPVQPEKPLKPTKPAKPTNVSTATTATSTPKPKH